MGCRGLISGQKHSAVHKSVSVKNGQKSCIQEDDALISNQCLALTNCLKIQQYSSGMYSVFISHQQIATSCGKHSRRWTSNKEGTVPPHPQNRCLVFSDMHLQAWFSQRDFLFAVRSASFIQSHFELIPAFSNRVRSVRIGKTPRKADHSVGCWRGPQDPGSSIASPVPEGLMSGTTTERRTPNRDSLALWLQLAVGDDKNKRSLYKLP